MIDWSTGAGSARPVVSMITRFSAAIRPVCSRSIRSASVSTRSPRTVQQRQPSASWMTPSEELLDQQMVDRHVAELVDDHRRVGERRILQEPVE